jgi:hypothetical protein
MSKRRVTPEAIHAFRGIFRRRPGEKSATQELVEDRAEDFRLEEAKFQQLERLTQRRRQ